MNTDLLSVARTLAERGWLPGIGHTCDGHIFRTFTTSDGNPAWDTATEADLHLAAHKYITDPKRKWDYKFSFGTTIITTDLPEPEFHPGTDTLALLRCLLAACEASEGKETTNGS